MIESTLANGIHDQDSKGVVSKNFEFRYYTPDVKANGETDLKGETAVFDTKQRIEFLNAYANYASTWFGDPKLNGIAAPAADVAKLLSSIKPQPLPS